MLKKMDLEYFERQLTRLLMIRKQFKEPMPMLDAEIKDLREKIYWLNHTLKWK